MSKTTIGNVAVWRGEPPDGNPYIRHKGNDLLLGVTGDERVEALRRFRDGEDTSEYTFWHAPVGGGARRISSPDEIDWTQMRG